MLSYFVTLFDKTSSVDELEPQHKKSDAKNIVYRDELSKTKPAKTKPKKVDFLEYSEPLIKKESGLKVSSSTIRGTEQEKGVIRVKVKMTKQEADRLLSRCKDGGVLEFKDVARELMRIPVDRVTVFDNPPSTCSGSAVLKTIPEELGS